MAEKDCYGEDDHDEKDVDFLAKGAACEGEGEVWGFVNTCRGYNIDSRIANLQMASTVQRNRPDIRQAKSLLLAACVLTKPKQILRSFLRRTQCVGR